MCLDLGDKRIGVAVSDMLGITSQAAGVIVSRGEMQDIDEIKKLIEQKNVGLLLIGYPISMDGSEGGKGAKIREQFERMKPLIPCEMMLWDERLSTKEAQRILTEAGKNWKKQRNLIDETAAQIILQSYLDTKTFKKEEKMTTEKNNMEEEFEEEEMEETLTLINDEGQEVELFIDSEFEFEGKMYIVLYESEDNDEAYIYRLDEDENGESYLVDIEDDEEFGKVVDYYSELDE